MKLEWSPRTKRGKAVPYPPEVWEQYDDVILREYHRRGPKKAKQYMEKYYRFFPTEAQWKNRLYEKLNVKNTHKPPLHERGGTPRSTQGRHSSRAVDFPHGYNHESPFVIYDDAFGPSQQPCTTSAAALIPSTTIRPSRLAPLAEVFPRLAIHAGHDHAQVDRALSESTVNATASCQENSTWLSTLPALSQRAPSVSSRSSIPSPAQAERPKLTSRLSIGFGHDDDGDNHWAALSSEAQSVGQMSAAVSQIDHTLPLESFHSGTPLPPSGCEIQSLTVKEEIIFSCSHDSSEATKHVHVCAVSSTGPTVGNGNGSYITNIATLSNEWLCKLQEAAEMLTACRARPAAFKIHYQIYLRLREAASDSWNNVSMNLMLRQVLACARLAGSDSELQACVDMLNEQLAGCQRGSEASKQLRLRIALSDVFYKGGKGNVATTHRAVASALLEKLDAMENIDQDVAVPDLVADFALVRAYAYKAGQQHRSIMKSRCSTGINGEEEKRRMREATNKAAAIIWRRISRVREPLIRRLMAWCQRQLIVDSQAHINFLQAHFVAASSSPSASAIKRLHVAALFGYFSMRKHEQRDLLYTNAFEGLDTMMFTSAADVLWVISALIVEAMQPAAINLSLTVNQFESAYDSVTKLMGLNWEALADQMLPVMYAALTCTKVSSERHRHNITSPSRLDQASELVSAVVRRELGVHVQMMSPGAIEPSRLTEPSPLTRTGTPGAIRMTPSTAPQGHDADSGLKSYLNHEATANDYMLTGESNTSSTWLSMKRIKEQVKQRLSWTRRSYAHITPTRSSPEASTDLENMELSLFSENDMILSEPSTKNLSLTTKARRSLHRVVEHFQPQNG